MTLALTALSSVWPLNRIWFSVVAIRGTVTHQVTEGHTHSHTRSHTVTRDHTRSVDPRHCNTPGHRRSHTQSHEVTHGHTHTVTHGQIHGHKRSHTVSRSAALLHTRSHMVRGVILISVRSQGSREIHQVMAHGPVMWLKPWTEAALKRSNDEPKAALRRSNDGRRRR